MQKQSSFESASICFGNSQDNKLYNPNIKLKEDEKDWLQGDSCQVCDLLFSRIGKAHHCRVCGRPICKSCSNKLINDKRSCDLCFMRVKMADQEKLKKQQIKAKRQAIEQLKNNIQSSYVQKDEMINDLQNLQKSFEIQELQHKIQLKQLDDQLKQKIEVIKQLTANNDRQTKNIQVEQSQIKETDMQNEDLITSTSKCKFHINQLKSEIDRKQKQLEQQQQNLEKLKENIVQYEEQQLQQLQQPEQKPYISESLTSTRESKHHSDPRDSQPKREHEHKHKDCAIF